MSACNVTMAIQPTHCKTWRESKSQPSAFVLISLDHCDHRKIISFLLWATPTVDTILTLFHNHKHREEDTEPISLSIMYSQQLLEIKHVGYYVLPHVALWFASFTFPQYSHEQLREGSYLSLNYSSLTAFSFVKWSNSLLFDLALELCTKLTHR